VALDQTVSARARAIVLLAQLIDKDRSARLAEDVPEVVDALIEAARSHDTAYGRALRELTPEESRDALEDAFDRVRERQVRRE